MILPSKELLSEVTRIPIEAISSINIGRSDLSIFKSNDIVEVYNIYELQHKMKEWALKKCTILSGINATVGSCGRNSSIAIIEELNKHFAAPTEFEAVTQACEWIYRETNR